MKQDLVLCKLLQVHINKILVIVVTATNCFSVNSGSTWKELKIYSLPNI